jgi:hypothetical protein
MKEQLYTVNASEKLTIFIDGADGEQNPYYVPVDRYTSRDEKVPYLYEKFDIYVGGVLMPEHLRNREYWDYRAKKRIGTYTLRITEALIAKQN